MLAAPAYLGQLCRAARSAACAPGWRAGYGVRARCCGRPEARPLAGADVERHSTSCMAALLHLSSTCPSQVLQSTSEQSEKHAKVMRRSFTHTMNKRETCSKTQVELVARE